MWFAVPALLALFGGWCLAARPEWIPLLDDVNLAVHEAGHLVFLPFAELWTAAGGSILQVLVPLVLAGVFAARRDLRSASVPLAWAAQSLLGVARYAADARTRALDLLTGDPDTHDWWFLLDRLDLLQHDQRIANAMRLVAAGLFAGAVVLAMRRVPTARAEPGHGEAQPLARAQAPVDRSVRSGPREPAIDRASPSRALPEPPSLAERLRAGLRSTHATLFQNRGEALVARTLRDRCPPPDFHLLNHVTLRMDDGTTQIDHVLVSRYGVFVIETKNYTGWIFGDAKSRTWTKVVYHDRYKFQNPIHQNYRHVLAVRALLDFLPPSHVHSVVIFSGDAEFKTPVPDGVFRLGDFLEWLGGCSTPVMSANRMQFCVGRLETARLALSRQTDVEHAEWLRRRHGDAA